MRRTTVSQYSYSVGSIVTSYLTVDTVRDQKHLQFILAHDFSGKIQLVVPKADLPNHVEIGHMLVGSTFIVTGKLVESKQSKTNRMEIYVHEIEITSLAQAQPINEDSDFENRFLKRVVDLKTEKSQLMLKLRSAFENGCREYSQHWGMTEIHTPKLMGGQSETGADVFKLKYFDTTAFLAQSPQFYKQMGIASGLEGVFEIGPVFRAEQSRSSRHMTEFTGLDVEIAWAFDVEDIMHLEYRMLTHAIRKLHSFTDEARRLFGVDLSTDLTVRYMDMAEAKSLLGANARTEDLTDENERQLYELIGADFIFVKNYPISKRPFYHMWEEDKGTTKSFDLIFRGIEITTGAIREHRLDRLEAQAAKKGIDLTNIDFYLDNFRYGCPPHGGFGLGVERVVTKLLGYKNVKEASFVARDPDWLIP